MCADTPDTPVQIEMFPPLGAAGAIVTPADDGAETPPLTRPRQRGYRSDIGKTHRYPIRPRKCKRCGQVFTPRYKLAKYCSNACRQAGHKARHKRKRKASAAAAEAGLIVHTCPHCRRNFLDRVHTLRVYCTGACTQAAYKARKRATVHALGALLALDHGKAFDLVERLGTTRARQQLQLFGMEYNPFARQYISLGAA